MHTLRRCFLPGIGQLPSFQDAARFGDGSNISAIRLLPQRGNRKRLSSRESGNARPRVQTSVSKSNSW
jgi:hypothetical protein